MKLIQLSASDASADIDTPQDAAIQLRSGRFLALAAGVAGGLVALTLARGRVLLPVVGAGLFTGVVVAMHLTNAIPAMETDQSSEYQLALKIDAIRSVSPDGSVIFCQDQATLNDLQFVGDYSLYDGQTFRRDWVQNLPNADSPDQPQGLDPGRRDALYKRLKDFTQPQLDEQGRRIIHDALLANRRVFFVLPAHPNDPIPKKMRRALGLIGKKSNAQLPDVFARLCTPDRFTTEIVSVWPGYVPALIVPKVNKPRGLKPDRPPDPLGARQAIELIEVTLRPA